MVDFDTIAVEVGDSDVDDCEVVGGEVVRAAHKLLPTLPTVLVARILLEMFHPVDLLYLSIKVDF